MQKRTMNIMILEGEDEDEGEGEGESEGESKDESKCETVLEFSKL
jgi:hypothetical protein